MLGSRSSLLIQLRVLLTCLTLATIRREWLRYILAILGTVTGLTVFAAISLTNATILRSFEEASLDLYGNADVSLVADVGGIPNSLVHKLGSIEGVYEILPVSFAQGRLIGPERVTPVTVLGTDLLSGFGRRFGKPEKDEPRPKRTNETSPQTDLLNALRTPTIYTTVPLSSAHKSGISNPYDLQLGMNQMSVQLGGILPSSSGMKGSETPLVVIDIAFFQELTQSFEGVDQIDLILTSSNKRDEVVSQIEKLLPPQVTLRSSASEQKIFQNITAAFRHNLTLLAVLSLVVGMLLLYNFSSFVVLQRRSSFFTVCSLGVTVERIKSWLIIEALLLGVFCSFLAAGSSVFLAEGVLYLIGITLESIYSLPKPPSIEWDVENFLVLLLLGPTMMVCSVWLPVRDLDSRAILTGSSVSSYEEKFHLSIRVIAFGSLLLMSGALFSAFFLSSQSPIVLGFVPPVLLLTSFATCTPIFLLWLTDGSKVLLRSESLSVAKPYRGKGWFRFFEAGNFSCNTLLRKLFGVQSPFELNFAFEHIRMTLRRTAVAVSTIVLALGLYIGSEVMITNFRTALAEWIHHITPADLYVSSFPQISGDPRGRLPRELLDTIHSLSEIENIDEIRTTKIRYGDRLIQINGSRFDIAKRYNRFVFMEGPREGKAVTGFPLIYASDVFARRFDIKLGDTITLATLRGEETFQVHGVFRDFANDQGTLALPLEVFKNSFEVRESGKFLPPVGVSLYLKDPAEREKVFTKLSEEAQRHQVWIRDSALLRLEVLKLFDRTFLVAYGVQVIALLVSILALILCLSTLALERQPELTQLRALGAHRAQVKRFVLVEGMIVVLAGALLAFILGGALGWMLGAVTNPFFFGWHIPWKWQLLPLLKTPLMSLGVAYIVIRIVANFLVPADVSKAGKPFHSLGKLFVLLGVFSLITPGQDAYSQSPPNSFREVNESYEFEFPRSHGSHPEYSTEWWYFTGHLKSETQRTFGFELTFFRIGVESLSNYEKLIKTQYRSPWYGHSIYLAHFALTDDSGKKFYFSERKARSFPGQGRALQSSLDVSIGSWKARAFRDVLTLFADAEFGTLSLRMKNLKPVVLHGKNGISVKGPRKGQASLYTSLTRLEGSGNLRIGNEDSLPVQVEAWMDHEVTSSQIAANTRGWDWFALQLNDGEEFMLYLLKDTEGKPTRFSAGSWIQRDGGVKRLGASDFFIKALGFWESPTTHIRYPSGWEINIPSKNCTLQVAPTVKEQEIESAMTTGVTYWEGRSLISGTCGEREVEGQGYVELVGYRR